MRSTPAAELLVQILDRLRRIEQLLEHGRGPRDQADRALLLAILESVGDRPFTCSELMQHAELADPSLRDALLAADVPKPHELGTLLRRLQRIAIAGARVERIDDSRAGAIWRVRLCEGDWRTGASGEDRAHD